jgi:hypothetical protein
MKVEHITLGGNSVIRDTSVKVTEPVAPQWLYSAIIDPKALSIDEMMTAGEVELYIYEQLYLSYINR